MLKSLCASSRLLRAMPQVGRLAAEKSLFLQQVPRASSLAIRSLIPSRNFSKDVIDPKVLEMEEKFKEPDRFEDETPEMQARITKRFEEKYADMFPSDFEDGVDIFNQDLDSMPANEVVSMQFVVKDGRKETVKGIVGEPLLLAAMRAGYMLHNCGGGTAGEYGHPPGCAFCHCYLPRHFCNDISEEEKEGFDFVRRGYHEVTDTTRLACQVDITKDMDGMIVGIPMLMETGKI